MRCVPPIRAAGLLFAAIIAAGASADPEGAERYDADIASSRLTVEGTSTLHDWQVEGQRLGGYVMVQENELASLWGNSDPPSQPLAPTVHVEIPVTSLTSGTRGMDGKMHEALKATTHPTITYRLESAKIKTRQTAQEGDSGGSLIIDTTGVLTVVGAERTVDIPMQVKQLSNDRLEISGDTSLRMTEFGIDPPRAMLGTLRTGDTVHVQWTWVLALSQTDHSNPQAPLPVAAEDLMPLTSHSGVYLVTEGIEKGKQVPFTFEQHGNRWILTKEGLARHELHRDQEGNLLIDREIDLREDREIEYLSPVVLLPAMVDSHTSLTGTTRVIVRSTRSSSAKYRGVCNWRLDFIGIGAIDTPDGVFPTYRLRATREIRLALAQISMTIDFEYARGKGMIATGVDQLIRSLGLFTERDVWRLEQLP